LIAPSIALIVRIARTRLIGGCGHDPIPCLHDGFSCEIRRTG
jgi:hypothetical protein